MWSRAELKAEGKEFVKRHLGKAVLVSLIFGILSGIFAGQSSTGADYAMDRFEISTPTLERMQENRNDGYNYHLKLYLGRPNSTYWMANDKFRDTPRFLETLVRGVVLVVSSTVFIILFIVSILGKFFIYNPIKLGKNKFFVEGYEKEPDVASLLHYFRSSDYWNTVKNLFLKDVYLFLWSLLLLIPGIYKGYQYFYVEYLLMEDPTLDLATAIEISKKMTDGDKWNIFVLEFSFIGWYFLSALLFSLPDLLINPYVEATLARLYLRKKEFMMEWAENY